MDGATVLRGSCHCGCLRIAVATRQVPAAIVPRACDCAFCRKHGAAWISDPAGQLRVTAGEAGTLREYEQGSNAARFLLCARCGVLVAAIFRHASGIRGVANAGCLDGDVALGAPATASPQWLGPDEKVARWLRLWIADVVLEMAGA